MKVNLRSSEKEKIMNVLVSEVKTTKKAITIIGTDVEAVLCYDNLNEDFELHQASFVFPFGSENANAQKYLLKVLLSCKSCAGCKSIAEMLSAIVANPTTLYLSDNFRSK